MLKTGLTLNPSDITSNLLTVGNQKKLMKIGHFQK